MRNPILVVVILQLTITVIEIDGKFKFGDIIAFPKKLGLTYTHYAIYVGDKAFKNKDPKHNIFHRTGPVSRVSPTPSVSDCVFGTLNEAEEHHLHNYLDDVEMFKVGTPESIAARIQEKHGKCGTYNPFGNNCEHLATYVRYGVRLSLQLDKDAEKYCINQDFLNIDEIKKNVQSQKLTKEGCGSDCSTNRGRGPG